VGYVLALADRVLAWAKESGATNPGMLAAPQKARLLALRGDTAGACAVMRGVVERLRRSHQPQDVGPAYNCAALIEHLDGHPNEARTLIAALGAASTSVFTPIAEDCRILIADGFLDDAWRILDSALPRVAPRVGHALTSVEAMLAEANGQRDATALYETAAAQWRGFGDVYELAHALPGLSRTLNASGRSKCAAPLWAEPMHSSTNSARDDYRSLYELRPCRAAVALARDGSGRRR
jgi:hypothetical protein